MKKNIRQLLSFNMKKLRDTHKMSQADLAEKANVSTGHIASIETGKRFPSCTVLASIAEALEVRPYQLMQDEEDVAQANLEEQYCIIREKLQATLKATIKNTLENITSK